VSRIGIFDSGVGGLTVQRAILDALPGADTVYLGDTARVPYGTKSADTVTQYSLRNARVLMRQEIDLLVVACNTASAVALPALRAELKVPVLGVVEPGARVAARTSRTARIGVIGTQGTIASGAYQAALRRERPGAEVVAKPCPLFVPLAEEGWTDAEDEVVRGVVRRYLGALRGAGIDTLVLGCTHYPLLKGAIAAELPGVALVDSADAIAAEVKAHIPAAVERAAAHRFLVTDAPEKFLAVAGRFLGRTVDRAEHVDVRRRTDLVSPSAAAHPERRARAAGVVDVPARNTKQEAPAPQHLASVGESMLCKSKSGSGLWRGSTTTSSTRGRCTTSRPRTRAWRTPTSSRTSSSAGTSSRARRPLTPTSSRRRTSPRSSAS
jgi:glutamate racemase